MALFTISECLERYKKEKMKKSRFDFPGDDNKHVKFLDPSLSPMKKLDTKHVEIDDRYALYVVANGDDRYTGWFYYLHGADPVSSFINATIYDIVTIGYNQGIFSLMTEASIYNQEMTNSLVEESFDEAPVDPVPIEAEVIEDESIKQTDIAEMVEGLVREFNPTRFECNNYPEQGSAMITLFKSMAQKVIEKFPNLDEAKVIELIQKQHEQIKKSENSEYFDNFRIGNTIESGFDSRLDAAIQMRERIVEQKTKETILPTSNNQVVNEKLPFNTMDYTSQLHGIYVESQFRDQDDTAFTVE